MYNLVLEARPGEFMPIDINLLVKNNMPYNYSLIESIDAFTKVYSIKELYKMIEESNQVSDNYLNGKLHVINASKYRFPIFSKEINYSLDDFFIKYIDDKKVMNKFMNIYMKYSGELLNILKRAIKDKNIPLILDVIFKSDYLTIRNIYFYLYDNVISVN